MNGIEKHTKINELCSLMRINRKAFLFSDFKNYKEYKLNEIKLLLYNNSDKNLMSI
jgi:hypothetical protein